MEQKAFKYKKYGNEGLNLENDTVENFQARLALSYISRWGMVQGINDGEDSAGRSKLRLATPEEVVKRGFDVAELAFAEIEKREMWIKIEEKKEDDK